MTIIEHHQFKCQQCDAACSFPVVISRFRPVCVQNVMWTDGDISEPLTPRSHPAVICPTCREVHWIGDLETSNQSDSGWSGHSSLEPVYPTAEDYFRYAGGNQTKDEREFTPGPHFVRKIREVMLGGLLGEGEENPPLVILICRSGRRSLEAGQALIDAGIHNVYNVTAGFEGPLNDSHHRSTTAGWRFDQLPWQQC